MTSRTLYSRIRECLEESMKDTTLESMSDMKLLPIVGNGLTRLVPGAPTWDSWIREALMTIGEPDERFESLRRQGFEHPEILHFIFQEAANRKSTDPNIEATIWRDFGQNLENLVPTPLHMALVVMADRHVATTNYDALLEKAASRVGRYDPHYVLKPLGVGQELPSPFPPTKEELVIWKLHGSLPIPHSGGKSNPKELNRWITGELYKQLLATSASYRSTALTTNLSHFNYLQAAFENDDNLCLFLGTSLTSAELVILRLLYSRWGGRNNLFILNTGGPAERQISFAELGIQTLNVPKGLAGNSERRPLALAVLLEILLERIAITAPRRKKAERFLKATYGKLPRSGLTGTPMADAEPIVGCVGPLQTTRVIGLSDAAQQEAFHAPAKATRTPDPTQPKEVLISDGSMGQGGNPILVWDAMGLPTAVVAEIGDDAAGSGILDRLQNLKWTDFDGVLQVLPQTVPSTEASPGCRTESYTCVTWFGVRTGFDSVRFNESSRCNSDQWGQEFEKIRNVPILYLTKVLSQEVRDYFDSKEVVNYFNQTPPPRMPLIVCETGGGGDEKLEEWVADKHGIVIASAKTALRWIGQDKGIPGDEFGRYVQLARLLDHLREINEFVIETKGPLALARAIVVTLGELGALWWHQIDDRSRPSWTFPSSFEKHANESVAFKNGTSLPLAEIRDALGCGDCARPGFVVSLARSLDFASPSDDLRPEHMVLAVSSLCWFGIQKIRYFGMERFAKFLQNEDNTNSFWELWEASSDSLKASSVLWPPVPLGTNSFEVFETRKALDESNDLDGLLEQWLQRFRPDEKTDDRPQGENRRWIKDIARRWEEERDLKVIRVTT